MPQRTLVCRICLTTTQQTTPDPPAACETCRKCGYKGSAQWRVAEEWVVNEMDRRFLHSLKISPE